MRTFSLTTILFAALLMSGTSAALSFNMELDQATLQDGLSRAFPVQRNEAFITVQLSQPQVILKEGSDRIGLRTRATVYLPGGSKLSGTTAVDGKLRYAAKNNALYLDQARVRELRIDGLPEMAQQQVLGIANTLVRTLLDTQPLYVVPNDQSSSLLNKQISKLEVKNGKLLIEVSAF
jgi:hypothetical protein